MNKVIKNCKVGKNTKIWNFVNLYNCSIGNNCIIACYVEIQKNVKIGNFVKIESHTFICEGVLVEDNVFIGHHVVFINDKYPQATHDNNVLKTEKDWTPLQSIVKSGASIGSNATILGGITIGEHSFIGAGSVVTKDVPPFAIVAGNPAKILRIIKS